MISFLRSIPLHFKSAIQGLYRHSATAFSAISAVSVTLVLMSLFMLLSGNVDSFTRNIESDFKIHASIDNMKTQEEIDTMQQEIAAWDSIKNITFSTKDEELTLLQEESPSLFGMYETGDANPMRSIFIIEVNHPEEIESVRAQLADLEGIENPQYGGDGVATMIQVFAYIRNGGFMFVAALSLLAIFLISNTIRMTIYARKSEISIMRNVGANNWFIRIPFLIEGMFIGFIGAVVPVILTYVGYTYAYQSLHGYFLSSMFVMKEVHPFVVSICFLLTGCGILVGIMGSFLAVSKYLRWKR